MRDNPWEAAKLECERFTEVFRETPAERQSAMALAEIARQLIMLNTHLNVLSSVSEDGLNRIADNS
jgi:hypothetical protein